MELKIRPYPKNTFPPAAILLQGDSVAQWVREIQGMGLPLEGVAVYPVPGTVPNSVWGCLVVPEHSPKGIDIGKNNFCQCMAGRVYIPENSVLFPALSADELAKLFPGNRYLAHPELGWVELTDPLLWEQVLAAPPIRQVQVQSPAKPVFIPMDIKSFQVKPVSPEETLKDLVENAFPQTDKPVDKPLGFFEKIKLEGLKTLFRRTKNADGSHSVEKTGLMNAWEKFRNLFTKTESRTGQQLQENFEDLENRNQKALDRLMDLFRNNPEEALKYAIPLDESGGVRGGDQGLYTFSKRWSEFGLFGGDNSRPSSGSVTMQTDHYEQLRQQYRQTAQDLIRKKEHRKAAFVYIKLLKEYNNAGQTMEDGELYQEAAAVHLKYTKDKNKAAGCYEKGHMYTEAIDLYKELNENEKVGDLYLEIHQRPNAHIYYEKVVDTYRGSNQYVKASLLYRNKMEEPERGQSMLLEGWRSNRDGYNCLNNYFNNIDDVKQRAQAIDHIYHHETDAAKRPSFLNVIKLEYKKRNGLEEPIRDMAYEIIAEELKTNPEYASELRSFNETDTELTKDTMRYRLNRKK